MTKDDDGASHPLDLKHLAEQTFGSAELEAEVLRLFLKQARDCMSKLRTSPDAATAHLLLGSARGIGATTVANTAAALEARLLRGGAVNADLSELDRAVKAATAFIEAHLGTRA